MNAKALHDCLERGQIPVYLVAIGLGIAFGLVFPGMGESLVPAITPVLAALLYTTFLQVPFAGLRASWANRRFFGALLAANFLALPLLVSGLFRWVPADPAVRLGALLVLLTPCVDYVVVFTHLGRGNARLLLAATPLLLLAQMLLLPFYLWLFLGTGSGTPLQVGPFVDAFLWLIAIPLILAWLTERWASRQASGTTFANAMAWGPIPLMALTMFLVVGSEVPRIGNNLGDILSVVPIYLAYAVLAPIAGLLVTRLFALGPDEGRALVFSVSTRNSLVVLPLALVAPSGGLVAAAVVTQTLIELLAELAYVRLVPKILPKCRPD